MYHDDRLATVLRLAVSAPAMARIQWRQLIDLIGTAPADARGDLVDAGYVRLGELAGVIPAEARARILSEPGVRLRSPRLLVELARGEPAVAAAALAGARLAPEAWTDLVPALPPAARAMLHGREDLGAAAQGLLNRLGVRGRALPGSVVTETVTDAVAVPDSAPDVSARIPPVGEGIGDVVRRIEAFRRARSEPEVPAQVDSPRLPLGDSEAAGRLALAAFDFVTDVNGRVVWSPPETAPMVIGLSLAALSDEDGGRLGDAIRLQQPLRGVAVRLVGARAITGRWQIDAVAKFETSGGRYTGHAGRFRRLAEPMTQVAEARPADRLRQLLHELRTPVNAIQGFAEIIQQQLFGPTPHDYRAYAAAIAADAARMLAGFEELERYARLDTGAEQVETGASDILAALAGGLAAPETVHVVAEGAIPAVAVAADELERLCWRVLAALAGHAAAGEALLVRVSAASGQVRAAVALPATLAGMDDAGLFAADAASAQRPRAGMFGTGFALRLAAAEARSAGGGLSRVGETLVLALPAVNADLTALASGHSPDAAMAGAELDRIEDHYTA